MLKGRAVLPRRDGLKPQMRRAAGPGLREPRDATRGTVVVRLSSSHYVCRYKYICNKYTLEAEKRFKTCKVKKNRSKTRDSFVKWQ